MSFFCWEKGDTAFLECVILQQQLPGKIVHKTNMKQSNIFAIGTTVYYILL